MKYFFLLSFLLGSGFCETDVPCEKAMLVEEEYKGNFSYRLDFEKTKACFSFNDSFILDSKWWTCNGCWTQNDDGRKSCYKCGRPK